MTIFAKEMRHEHCKFGEKVVMGNGQFRAETLSYINFLGCFCDSLSKMRPASINIIKLITRLLKSYLGEDSLFFLPKNR